jgi:hypothetical protein
VPSLRGQLRIVRGDSVVTFAARRYWPSAFLAGNDHNDVPVELCKLGQADIPGIEKHLGRELFVQCAAAKNEECFEMLRQVSREQQRVVTSCSLIFDMHGLGRRHVFGVPGPSSVCF